MARSYPKVEEAPIRLIKRLYNNDPEYFNDPACPYSSDLKALFIKPIIDESIKTKPNFDDFEIADLSDNMLDNINALHIQLEQYYMTIQADPESKATDKNTYFRLKAGLLEKIIDLKERAVNIEQYGLFVETILDIMDRELTPDSRENVMRKLKQIANKE